MSHAETGANYIQFLGTAGARFAMARQARSTAGTFLFLEGKRILLDMGPGTLVRCNQVSPPIDVFKLDALILTHSHIDHSTDINCLIDAMTGGGLWKRGRVYAPRDCIEGESRVILSYLRRFPKSIEALTPGAPYNLDGLTFETSIAHDHGVETYGIRFNVKGRRVSFLIDTRNFAGLKEDYEGADTLAVNVVRNTPQDAPTALHLCMEDVEDIVAHIRPRKTILTHFGMRLLEADPTRIAAEMAGRLGLDIVAAADGMIVEV